MADARVAASPAMRFAISASSAAWAAKASDEIPSSVSALRPEPAPCGATLMVLFAPVMVMFVPAAMGVGVLSSMPSAKPAGTCLSWFHVTASPASLGWPSSFSRSARIDASPALRAAASALTEVSV